MANEVTVFNFETNEVRTVVINDEVLFVGKDVASALGYSNTNKAVQVHVDEDDKTQSQNGNEFGQRGVSLINESGVYSLIFSSKLEGAKRFKKWITSEVLPSIRKTGSYSVGQNKASYLIDDPIERAKQWIKEQEEKRNLETKTLALGQEINELKPKADYTDVVLNANGLVTVTQIAKDYGMTAQEFNKTLKKLGIQYKQSSMWFLYKDYQDKGWTQSKTFVDDGGNTRMNTKWTQKGRLGIYNILKQHEIIPVIEQDD